MKNRKVTIGICLALFPFASYYPYMWTMDQVLPDGIGYERMGYILIAVWVYVIVSFILFVCGITLLAIGLFER